MKQRAGGVGDAQHNAALWFTAAAVVAFALAVVLSAVWQPSGQSYAGWEGLWLSSLLAYAVVGGLVAWHRPGNPVGWLCLAGGGAAMVAAVLDVVSAQALVTDPGSIPGGLWMRWGQAVLFSVSLTMLPAFPLLFFPDGHLPSRRWRGVLVVAVILLAASTLVAVFSPGPLGEAIPGDNPLGIPVAGFFEAVDAVLWPALSVLTVGVLASLALRWRRASGEIRGQLSWLALASLAAVASVGVETLLRWGGAFGPVLDSGLLAIPLLLGVPAAIGIGMLRHRLFDVEVVLTRALAYAVLSGLVLLVYVGTLLVASRFLRSSADVAVSLIATAVLAVSLSPVKDRLVGGIDRWLFGDRRRPYALLASLAERLEEVARPENLLGDLAEVIRSGLKLPFVAVAVPGGQGFTQYSSGERGPGELLVLPLLANGHQQGQLLVGRRSGEEFTPAEGAVLADVARQVAIAVHSTGLAGQLQASREHLVIAREEERRRVRRDLHDGVGPVLAALTLQLDALRRRLPDDDVQGRQLADRMKVELQRSVADVRRVVEGLRPPSLDDLGLAGTVEEHGQAVSDGRLEVRVEVDEGIALSPAVEVAAYRILTEAITNVARHADATDCHVTAQLDGDGLLLEVSDNGRGLAAGRGAGIGLTTMRDRAAELGGTFEAIGGANGSTVRAWLPVGGL